VRGGWRAARLLDGEGAGFNRLILYVDAGVLAQVLAPPRLSHCLAELVRNTAARLK